MICARLWTGSRFRPLPFLLALASLSTPAGAAFDYGYLDTIFLREAGIPSGMTSGGLVSDMITGDFDADGRQDIVRIYDGKLLIHYGVGVFDAVAYVDQIGLYTANSLALLPGDGAIADRIVSAGPTGTCYWEITLDGSAFKKTSLSPDSASDVAVAETSAGHCVVALENSGTELHAMHIDGYSISSESTIANQGPSGIEIVTLEWLAGSDDSVAVHSFGRVEVYSLDGTLEDGYDAPLGSSAIAALDNGTGYADQLAWIVTAPVGGSTYSFVMCLGSGFAPGNGQVIGAVTITGASSTDLDMDGTPDLVMAVQDLSSLDVFLGNGAATGNDLFLGASLGVIDGEVEGSPGLQPSPAPVFADFDNDGVMDIVNDHPDMDGFLYRQRENSIPQLRLKLGPNVLFSDSSNDGTPDTLHFRRDESSDPIPSDYIVEVMIFKAPQGEGVFGEALGRYRSVYGDGDQLWTAPLDDFYLDEDFFVVSRVLDASGNPMPDSVILTNNSIPAVGTAVEPINGPWMVEPAGPLAFGKGDVDEGIEDRVDIPYEDVVDSPPGRGDFEEPEIVIPEAVIPKGGK